MRVFFILIHSIILSLAITSLLFAQPPGRPGMGMGPPPGHPGGHPGPPGGRPPGGKWGILVRNPVVREYLGVTDDQIKQFEMIIDTTGFEVMKKMDSITGGTPPPDWTPEIRKKVFEEMPEMMEKVTEETMGKYEKLLTPEQVEKARVLAFLASEGLDFPMIGVPFLVVLELTEEQKADIRKIQADSRAQTRNLLDKMLNASHDREPSAANREGISKKMQEINKETTDKIKGVLTAEQRQKAEDITREGEKLMQDIFEAERAKHRDEPRWQRRPEGPPPGPGIPRDYRRPLYPEDEKSPEGKKGRDFEFPRPREAR